jgi:cellulose synthase/poly-beta-1,6-N-acetylglucosamine synthase-like glycosyltransferase
MTFLPYEKFVIKTHLSPDVIMVRLEGATETQKKWAFFWQEHKPYRGKIVGNEFGISRWISYRNDFLPMIQGHINPEMDGSSVYVIMSMYWFVILFVCIWLSFYLLFFLASIANVLDVFQSSSYSFNWLVCIAPLGALLFVYLLTTVSFKTEAAKSQRFLEDLLESDDVTELGLFETELNT